jgi:hypothetical protein
MMVTRRSSSSEFRSPALHIPYQYTSQFTAGDEACIPLVKVDIGLLANDVGVATANTLDLSQGVHNFALAIDVGVQETENVLYTAS